MFWVVVLGMVVPQLAGYAATRFVRRSTFATWPAMAIVVFSTIWLTAMWLPMAHTSQQQPQPRCGEWLVVAGFALFFGLTINAVTASILSTIRSAVRERARRPR